MAENTHISWADSTFNPWIGCTAVGPGCDHCYAELYGNRWGIKWGDQYPRRRTAYAYWQLPDRWQAGAKKFFADRGHRQRVFAASLADIFDKCAPEGALRDFWAKVHDTPDLDWMIVTKRSGRILKSLPENWGPRYSNVIMIVTVCNQAEFDRDVPRLLALKLLFPWLRIALSIEPMLGAIDISAVRPGTCVICKGSGLDRDGDYSSGGICANCKGKGSDELNPGLDLIICGGESQQLEGTRDLVPLRLKWVRDLRDQCAELSIPFHFKQWGAYIPADQTTREMMARISDAIVAQPYRHKVDRIDYGQEHYLKLGAQFTGRRLDGVEHNGYAERIAA